MLNILYVVYFLQDVEIWFAYGELYDIWQKSVQFTITNQSPASFTNQTLHTEYLTCDHKKDIPVFNIYSYDLNIWIN